MVCRDQHHPSQLPLCYHCYAHREATQALLSCLIRTWHQFVPQQVRPALPFLPRPEGLLSTSPASRDSYIRSGLSWSHLKQDAKHGKQIPPVPLPRQNLSACKICLAQATVPAGRHQVPVSHCRTKHYPVRHRLWSGRSAEYRI
jgi:hypothetical protein